MYKSKFKWKSLMCILLCVSMLCNTLSSVLMAAAEENTSDTPAKMIYLDSERTGGHPFGMQVKNLEKNTQYTISFQCKVEEGQFNNTSSDKVYLRVLTKAIYGGDGNGAQTLYQSHVGSTHENAFDRITTSEDDYTRTYTFTTNDTDTTYGIAFHFNGVIKMYIADFKLYKTDDPTAEVTLPVDGDSEVLTTNTSSNGAHGWAYKWPSSATFNSTATEMTVKDGANVCYTAKLMDYDSEAVFVPALPEGPKMIYVDATAEGKDDIFGQNVELEKGKSYTISFRYAFEEGDMNVSTYLLLKAAFGSDKYTTYRGSQLDGEKGFTVTKDEATNTVMYTFTHTQDSGAYGVAFQCVRETRLYLANFTMYETEDAEKKNILPSAEHEESSLNGWRSDWVLAGETATFKLMKSDKVMYTASLQSYDEELFRPPLPEGQKMIYVDATADGRDDIFGQNVELEKGKSYTISFQYAFEEGDMNVSTYLLLKAAFGSDKYTTYRGSQLDGEKGFTVTKDRATGTVMYTFTHTQDSGTYGVAFQCVRETRLYLANFTMYETEDAEKKNILLSAEYEEYSLNGWRSDWVQAGETEEFELKKNDKVMYTATLQVYDASLFGSTLPAGEKMIYLDVTSDGKNDVFGQNVALEKGKSYSISFQYEYLQGDMNVSSYLLLKDQFGSDKYGTYRGTHLSGDKGFTVTKDQATGTVTYTFTHTQESGTYGVAFQCFQPTKLYLANFTMYETSDANKTNILPSAQDEDYWLNGWRSDWVLAGETEKFELKNASESVLYTATLQAYDATLFGPTLPAGPKMIYLDVTANGKDDVFGQNVELEKGKSYTISYQYKFEKGDMNVTTYLLVKAAFGSDKYTTYQGSHLDGAKGFTKTEDEATCTVSYTFTHTQESGIYGVGFQCFQPTQLYLANFTMYETSDVNKTNILPSAEDANYWLKGWRSDWSIIDETEEFVLKGNNVVKYTATLKPYDASIFVPRKIEPTMIYIEATQKSNDTTFGQNVKLEKGKSYTVSFRYKFKEGDINSSVYLRVKAPLGSGKYTTYYDSNATGSTGMTVKYDKETCAATYTFTHGQESGTYCIGFQFVGATKVYLTDFKVCETTDTTQKNLLPSKGYEDSLFGWSSDWQEAKVEKSFELKNKDNAVILKALAMPLDESIFKPDPELPPKMIYIENNGTYRQLLQRVKLVPGETYRFSFVVATPIALGGMVMHKGERVTIFNNMQPINNPDYKKDYYEVVYEFTLPKTYGGEAIDTSNIFVGLQLPPNSTAYVYNPKLWNVNDAEQTNIYVNPGFNKGLDNWVFSWGAWFIAGLEGTGLNEYESEGNFKLQVMDYDTQKFITYYNDSRIDDGEWWTAEDVASEEVSGSATINGRFLTQSDEPIAKAKMVLKSLKGSYECETDKNGIFKFEKLPAGFYELYYVEEVDGKENLIKTGFAQNIKDGYTVNVDVYADVDTVTNGVGSWTWFIVGDVLVIAVIVGIVFVLKQRKKKGSPQKAEG